MNLEALDLMDRAGIIFVISGLDGGYRSLAPADVPAYMESPAAWYAKAHHLTVEQVEAWWRYLAAGGRCQALTARGEQCRRGVTDLRPTPATYDPGVHDYCAPVHRRRGSAVGTMVTAP